MPELEDIELLGEYAGRNSETAFTTLVERYVNLVYSTALRSAGNAHAAQEISQAVFIILARKAKSLGAKTVLSGWLYQTTRLTAANYLRTEIRRQKREQEAYMQSILNEHDSETWRQIAPILDDAISKLGAKDRDAIVLRFFENKSLNEVGAVMGASQDAAKMRVNRALEKLRKFFTKRGVTLTTAIIAGAVSANSVQAAPVSLAKTISAVAIAKGAAAGGSTLALVKGALKIMAWTKAQTAVVVGAVVLLAAGTATVAVKEIEKTSGYPWQIFDNGVNGEVLQKAPPLMEIRPTVNTSGGSAETTSGSGNDVKRLAMAYSVQQMMMDAYGSWSEARTILATKLPSERYDYIDSLPKGATQAFKDAIKSKFGVVGRIVTVETNVLLLQIKNPNVTWLKPSPLESESEDTGQGMISLAGVDTGKLAWNLEVNVYHMPVVDETGLTNRFDFKIEWDVSRDKSPNLDELNKTLVDQLGLELVPTNMPIEMLVVEKAK